MKTQLTIDRIEGDLVILKTENNQSIDWPTNLLPINAYEGMVVNFTITDQQEAEKDKKESAISILNEILNTEE